MRGIRVNEVPFCSDLYGTNDGIHIAEVTLPTKDEMAIAYRGLCVARNILWWHRYDGQLLNRIDAARAHIGLALDYDYPGVVLHSGQSMHVHTVARELSGIKKLPKVPLEQPIPYEAYVAMAAQPVEGEAASFLYVPMPTLVQGDSIPLPPNVDRLSIPVDNVSRIIHAT